MGKALLLLCGMLLLMPGGSLMGEETQALPEAAMILQWVPQSQFAGYYVAEEKGFYREAGVDLTLIRGGPERSEIEYLHSGRAQFATMFLTGALTYRDEGYPLVHVSQLFQHATTMLVGWKEQGIRTVEDLDGRRVSLWGADFRAPYLALFAIHDVQPKIIPQYYSINLFLRKGVAATAAMHYNEYHTLYQSGVDTSHVSTFFLRDSGLNLPEDGIYCMEQTWQSQPEVCRAVAEGSWRGWRWAYENREATLDIVMARVREAHVPTNRAHMAWMLEVVLQAVFPEGDPTIEGVLDRDEYENAVELLTRYNMISSPPEFGAFVAGEANHAP